MMTAAEIRQRYIDFFVKKHGHTQIPSASIIPENDPTVLFTTAGMHPLVPYLMGEPHPQGVRLVNAQKCLRTDDIDEVGDTTHLTFFEMMGNWSLGDYFKKESIAMSYELLTSSLKDGGFGLDPTRICVTCFGGDNDAPRDDDAARFWEELGFERAEKGQRATGGLIFFYEKKENWWGPAGQSGPCGPDTEIFYDAGIDECDECIEKGPSCDCNKWVEIWNNVFMQYNKTADGKFEPLQQQNVDTGLGLERMTAIMQNVDSPFETDLFADAKQKIDLLSGHTELRVDEQRESVRIIADHLRAATFILGDQNSVAPSNVDQGYIVRRLIRRAVRHGKLLGIDKPFTHELADIYIRLYEDAYPELRKNNDRIIIELKREEEQFGRTLERGLRELHKLIHQKKEGGELMLSGEEAFYLFETYGFPLEMIEEELTNQHVSYSQDEFEAEFEKKFQEHQKKSRAGAEQKFAGGLADHSEQCKMHHTATHLLLQALREVLGDHVEQKGSNITKERLRFDFNHPEKMTPEQKQQVEDLVNKQIERDLPVHYEVMEVEEAKKRGAIGVFDDKYAQLNNKVKIYIMGDFSMEVCGGPHVEHTGVLKHFKIKKEQSCSAGIRRIKAVVDGIHDVE